jgi:NAD/NADP transhydrogenase alpha subunit
MATVLKNKILEDAGTITGSETSGGSLTLRSTTNATKGRVIVDETTESSSSTTGAFTVAGGVGIAKRLTTGGNIVGPGPSIASIDGYLIDGGVYS